MKNLIRCLVLAGYLTMIPVSYNIMKAQEQEAFPLTKGAKWTQADRIGMVMLSTLWPITLPMHYMFYSNWPEQEAGW